MGYNDQIGWKDDPGLYEIPVKIAKKYRIPVIMVLREGGKKSSNLSWEKERRRLRDYYLANGIGVYPTIDRALRSLGQMLRYYIQRQEILSNNN